MFRKRAGEFRVFLPQRAGEIAGEAFFVARETDEVRENRRQRQPEAKERANASRDASFAPRREILFFFFFFQIGALATNALEADERTKKRAGAGEGAERAPARLVVCENAARGSPKSRFSTLCRRRRRRSVWPWINVVFGAAQKTAPCAVSAPAPKRYKICACIFFNSHLESRVSSLRLGRSISVLERATTPRRSSSRSSTASYTRLDPLSKLSGIPNLDAVRAPRPSNAPTA